MANIDNVQLPDGSSYNIVDNTSGFATQNYVDSAVASVTKTTIGLGNVDNTSDLNKPVSTAQQIAIDNAVAPKVNKTDIAPVESSSTASQRHEIGDQFYFNGQLVTATAIIAQGATITLNGNCTLSESVTEQIESLMGVERFSLTPISSSQTAFIGYGIYDKSTNTVRIYVASNGASEVASLDVAENIPMAYRPSVQKDAVGICDGSGAVFRITIDGKVVQTHSSSYRAILCVGEYTL